MNATPTVLLRLIATCTVSLLGLFGEALAATPDFGRDIFPILKERCLECHGEKKQKSSLRLDNRQDALKGGDSGAPALVPGNAQASALLEWVLSSDKDKQMPPKGERLSAVQKALLADWINQGATWPEQSGTQKKDPRDHWSFKPVTAAAPPTTRDSSWPINAIDRFVLAKLEAEGLHPAPESDRAVWLRRVHLDLTGLPPTPPDTAAFLADTRSDSHARVIDALLQSPHYGERWAQHWLDVVRYADTHGFEVNTERPNAWPYRDYVIQALNEDRPYDRFIREQIAGDAFGCDAATGFLVTASVLLPGQIGADDISKRLARQDAIDEIVVNTGQTFLGLSVGCARCHDHKFDPISQADYYSMQAFFAGVEYLDRPLRTPEAEAFRVEEKRLTERQRELEREAARFAPLVRSGIQRPPINPALNTDRFAPVRAKRVRFTINATNSLEPYLDELEVFNTAGANVALASAGARATASAGSRLEALNDGVFGNAHSWISKETGRGWVELEFAAEETIERVQWGRDREGKYFDRLATNYCLEAAPADGGWQILADSSDRKPRTAEDKKPEPPSAKGLAEEEAKALGKLNAELESLKPRITAAKRGQQVFAGAFREPDCIHKLYRGDPEQPREELSPAVLSVLGGVSLDSRTSEQQRRLALADWIASAQNPLTARVLVNRVWQWHFGTGLAETASDLGHSGMAPSHPELLDWLAAEFMRGGWSLKKLHRLITLSATYRQSSRIDPIAQHKDADTRLLWRFPSRRIEAEAVRDSMLSAAGMLDLKMGGPGFNLFNQRGGLSGYTPVESFRGEGLRRMIYAHKVRRERDAVFGALDCPDGGQSTARRRESTTPIQALNLFNSTFTIEQSNALAERVKRDAGQNPATQIQRAYQLTLCRAPSTAEQADALSIVSQHGLVPLCRALFNSNEFLFLE